MELIVALLPSLGLVLLLFGLCYLSGKLGEYLGNLGGRGNGRIGFWLGFLLSWVGWIIAAVLPAADGAAAAAPATSRKKEEERIARLEAELAAMKSAKSSGAKKSVTGETDERGIPTYKL